MGVSKRNPALDLLRIIATLCVISVHFFLNCGFYDVYIIGTRMYLMCIMRNFFMVCVPMFIVLTGYLTNRKTLSRNYYLGIKKTLAVYLLASVVCYLYTNRSFKGFIYAVLDFSAAEYSWYIEMYIGLFVLIPFLNVMYRGGNLNLPNEKRKYKRVLIGTLLVVTSVPTTLKSDVDLIPNWWILVYPLTYYLIGCYLSEYGLKLRKWSCAILLLIISVFSGTIAFFQANKMVFVFEDWPYYGSLTLVLQTVLLFNLLASLDLHNLPIICKKILANISNLCLGIYLVSQIFDDMFYSKLNLAVEGVGVRLLYFPIMVCAVFLCSLVLSAAMELIYVLLCRGCSWMKLKIGSGIPMKQ